MRSNDRLAEAAAFDNTLHARLAAGFLADSDIPAVIDSSEIDDPFRNARGHARVRLLVPLGRVDEARDLLVDAMGPDDRVPLEALEPLDPRVHRRPLWVSAVALLLVVAIGFAAVPPSFRVPGLFLFAVAHLAWRRRRRPS